MTTLKVKIESLDQTMEAVADAMKAAAGQSAPRSEYSFSFPSWEAMHRVLTPKRLEIMVMTGQGDANHARGRSTCRPRLQGRSC